MTVGGCNCSESDVPMTGGGKGKKLESETKKALYEKAIKYNIKGRSLMNKQQLVDAIRAHHSNYAKIMKKKK